MNLLQYYNKKVKIIDDEGTVFVGVVNDYIYPEDNETEEESIIIDTTKDEVIEFYAKDIKEIEIME